MKEYEYVALGIEELLIDELVGVICQENFSKKTYEHGFRKIFDTYRQMHNDYQAMKDDFENPEKEELLRMAFVKDCEQQREVMLERFIADAKRNCGELDIQNLVDQYIERLEKEDVITTGKRVCIYPYIISQIRKYEEGV